MRIDPLGETAIILRDLDLAPPDAAARIERAKLVGVIEAVASFETVGVFFDGDPPSLELLSAALTVPVAQQRPIEHVIPVWYEAGDDLAEVSARLALTPEEVVAAHSRSRYSCRAVGFCPGFAYLGNLQAPLAGLPRRPEPRVRVEPGSVAITGVQTAVYPLARPGGWWLIGRTPLVLVDTETDFFPIRAGDQVRFEPIDQAEFIRRKGERL